MAKTKTSKVVQLNSLIEQRDALERQIQRLNKDTIAITEICEKVRALAKESGVSIHEVAYALAPELATTSNVTTAPTPSRTRAVKVYKNPHNNEVIKTKGGNHKLLKEWKAEYGSSVVESWRSE